MAQADYNIASNPSGLALRLEVNEIFKAIQTINSGATPPSSTEAGMWWGDISDPNTFYLKMRNHTNDGWVNLYAYDVATSTIRALSNNKYLAEITGTTGAVFLPSGTTAQRPTLTSNERGLRYNTDNAELEFWNGTAWGSVGGDLNINSLTDKTTPINTDNMVLQETGGLLKRLSWSNLKATLLTYFDTLYSRTTAIFGIGQTWQNVTASRSAGVTYTNTTGKPIQIIITSNATETVEFTLFVDGNISQIVRGRTISGAVIRGSASQVILHGQTYSVSFNTGSIGLWAEIR